MRGRQNERLFCTAASVGLQRDAEETKPEGFRDPVPP